MSRAAVSAAMTGARTGGSYHVPAAASSPDRALRAVGVDVTARDVEDVALARLARGPVLVEEVGAVGGGESLPPLAVARVVRSELVPRLRVPRLALRRVEERPAGVVDGPKQNRRPDREGVEGVGAVERRARRRQVAASKGREERVDGAARFPGREEREEPGEPEQGGRRERQEPPRPRL